MGAEERLTDNPGSDLSPVLCTGPDGSIIGHYQAWNGETGEAAVGYQLRCRSGKWVKDERSLPSSSRANGIRPSLRVRPMWPSPMIFLAVAITTYLQSSLRRAVSETIARGTCTNHPAALRPGPPLAYDPQGRLWIAYEEGPEQWGKDYGALVAGPGRPALQQPLRPRRLPPGQETLAAGRRTAEFRGQASRTPLAARLSITNVRRATPSRSSASTARAGSG